MYHNTITAAEPHAISFKFPIPNHPDYFADVDGTIWSAKSGTLKRLSPKVCQNGYLMVRLHSNGKGRCRYVHQLVLETFRSDRPDPLAVAAHYPDPDKANCAIGNLIWTDRKSNAEHWLADGGAERRGSGLKLDPSKVRELRRLHDEGWTNSDLARRYGTGLDAIRCVLTGRTWSHV